MQLRLAVTAQSVSKWEQGESRPSLVALLLSGVVTKIIKDYLFSGKLKK